MANSFANWRIAVIQNAALNTRKKLIEGAPRWMTIYGIFP
jgi:hypothetical protein